MWRKNRSPVRCDSDQWGRRRCCQGVGNTIFFKKIIFSQIEDLNRNFDFHFGESGSSNDICSEIYGGPTAFSEPESRSV